ncbi:shikimate dehydrogenase [Tumebacillus lipolyticus]|uniref:Shikimate dehydrogenase (NADP(+)) n=1 Tax=Tumebacillus lipolyticus TaxID=1280370 RepID=A0ABW4ZUT3_9BACL
MPTSATRLVGLFGHPVAHSKSPQMHNAAFAHLSLDYSYLAFDVEPKRLQSAVESIRTLRMRGVNVTIPHKVAIIPYLDRLSREAELIGAVNTVVNDQGVLTGYNTDGIGYLSALEEETGFNVSGQRVLVLGAGGAARAVTVQLALRGTSELVVAARTAEKAAGLVDELQALTRSAALSWEAAAAQLDAYDLIINTTPVGMHPDDGALPIQVERLRPGQVVSDLIYNPLHTRLLQEAKARGCITVGGLGMFIHQGAHAFAHWTGVDAPVDVMRRTVETCL